MNSDKIVEGSSTLSPSVGEHLITRREEFPRLKETLDVRLMEGYSQVKGRITLSVCCVKATEVMNINNSVHNQGGTAR